MQDGLRFQINLRSSVCGIRRACLLTEMLTVVSRLQETLSVFSSQEKIIQTPFWWESVLGMRKCVFGLCFHFRKTLGLYFQLEDPREMKNYQDSSSFAVFSKTASTSSIFFFFKRLKPILQIYMLLEMEETLGNIKHFSKGISYAFGVGQYFMVRGHLC